MKRKSTKDSKTEKQKGEQPEEYSDMQTGIKIKRVSYYKEVKSE